MSALALKADMRLSFLMSVSSDIQTPREPHPALPRKEPVSRMLGPPGCDSSSRRRHSDAHRLDPRAPLAHRDQGDDGRDQRATREEEQASFEAAGRILEPADRDGPDQAAEVANRVDPG